MDAMHKVAATAELAEGRGKRVEIGEEKILLVRDGAEVRAYAAACPHAGAPLEEGAVCDGRILCPWHKAAFRVSDGALLEPPALDGLDRRQDPRRDAVDLRDQRHAGEVRDRHQLLPVRAGMAPTPDSLL